MEAFPDDDYEYESHESARACKVKGRVEEEESVDKEKASSV